MNLTELNQSDHCDHFSCPERSVSPAVYILLYVCSAAVVLLTVCANLLIIMSIIIILVGALLMPVMFIWMIGSCWIFGRDFCVVFLFIGSVLISLSIYNIVLIAVDRYLALSNPFLYTNTVTRRMMCIVIYSNWCMSLLYIMTIFYFNGNFMDFIMCPGECFVIVNEVWYLIDLIYSFIFPLSVIIILYTLVFVIVKKHVTAIRELNNHTRTKTQKITSHSIKSEKAAKVLGILVSAFLAGLLPYLIYTLLGYVIKLQTETFQKLLIILYLNSTINPVIYALFYPWFRRCVKLIITLQIFQTDSDLIRPPAIICK